MRVGFSNHISESDHLRYVDGELDEMEVGIIEDHLATCTECRDFNDDLAAASDGLTAFLNRADFEPRALSYTPRVAGGWWNSPIGKAAALVGLFVGLATPAALLLRVGNQAPLDDVAPALTTVPADPNSPVLGPGSPRLAPADRGSGVGAEIGGASTSFTINFSSWQAGGELKLVFSSSDVVIYNPGGRTGAIASINTMTGLMSIRTTINESSDHEIWIPANYRPEDVTVRIAGRKISFIPTVYVSGDETFVIIGAAPTKVARISLQVPEGLRPF